MIKLSISASRKYDILMKQGLLAKSGSLIAQLANPTTTATNGSDCGKKICIVTDANVNALYLGEDHALWSSLRAAGFDVYKYVFPGGEDHKTIGTISAILDYLAENKFSRSDLLLACGGGITGDITGFAAATYLRGIEFIQMPTTLLAVVDSSVGGKTGVNLKAGKNLAGAFWQPSLVLFDHDVLTTLSSDLMLDGFAEAIKAGFIADSSLIDDLTALSTSGSCDLLPKIITRAIEVKKKVVEEDERDNGSRQLLNFGHTVAHAIEKCSDYKISHGHAVAMGMSIVATASYHLGWSDEDCSKKINDILSSFGFTLKCGYNAEELAQAALRDKKIRGGNITLVIPAVIGKCKLKTIPTESLQEFIACGL